METITVQPSTQPSAIPADISQTQTPPAPGPSAFPGAGIRDPEVTLRLKEMLLEQREERKTAFLKDPAGYAAPMAASDPKSGKGSGPQNAGNAAAVWDSLSPEARASRHMAMQTYLAKGMEGFAPRVLTAQEAADARRALADPATDGATKLATLTAMRESYGLHGRKALEELELAPAVMAAAKLAETAPGFVSFAAEAVAEALFCPDPELRKLPREDRLARLKALAGTNEQARSLIQALMPQSGAAVATTMEDRRLGPAAEGILSSSGNASLQGWIRRMPYIVSEHAVNPEDAIRKLNATTGETVAPGKNTAQDQGLAGDFLDRTGDLVRSVIEAPGSAMHGGIKGINAAADLIYDGMDWLQEHGWFWTDDPIQRLAIPNLPDPQSSAGKMVSGVSQFLTGFKGFDKALKGVKAASNGANALKNAGTSFAADFAFFDGQEERLSNLVQGNPALANPINEFLAAKPDDGKAEGRLKNALEGLGLGAAAEAMLHGTRMIKAGREFTRGEMRGAEEIQDEVGRKAAMREREPAVTLTGKEFTTTDSKMLRSEVNAWYKQHLANTTGTHQNLGMFRFNADAGKPISKSADIRKLQIFPKLREVVETSEYVASSPSIKKKHISNVNATDYHYTRNTVQIGEELVDVGMVLRKDNQGQIYYDHMIHDMQAIKDAPWASPAEVVPLSPMGTKGPKGTRGYHPALHEASAIDIESGEGQVNLFILGVRSLRGLNTSEKKEKLPEEAQ